MYKVPKKLYHTSGHSFKVGDVIGGPHHRPVYMNSTQVPHPTIWLIVEYGFKSYKEYTSKDVKGLVGNPNIDIKVYEVKPYNRNKATFNPGNDEYITRDFVEIVKVVGNARSILTNFIKKYGRTYNAYIRAVKNIK